MLGMRENVKRFTEIDIRIYYYALLFMAALRSRGGHYIFALRFLSFFLLNFCRLDVYHTSTHGVDLVRIYNVDLKCAARSSLKIQDIKNRQNI